MRTHYRHKEVAAAILLEKPSVGFICNEDRGAVINKDFAKFRCNGLIVILIFDLVDNTCISSINHITPYYYMTTLYEVGKLVKPDFFDSNLNDICTHGIHYFLTLKAATCYNEGICIIDSVRYDANGRVFFR
jgi:hypothetical protein